MVAINTPQLPSLMLNEDDMMWRMGDFKNIPPEDDNTAVVDATHGIWNITKLNMANTGMVAIVNTIEPSKSELRVGFRLPDGSHLYLDLSPREFDELHLRQEEYVILTPRESSASGNALTGPARVPSLVDQESDCTQCFPTGP